MIANNPYNMLMSLASNPDLFAHQQAHNAVLRQLVDAATISNFPIPDFNKTDKHMIEVEFHD